MELDKLITELHNLQSISRWFAIITAIVTPFGVIGGLVLSYKIEDKQEQIENIYKNINATSGKFDLSGNAAVLLKANHSLNNENDSIYIKFGGWNMRFRRKDLISGREIPLNEFDVRVDQNGRPLPYTNPLTLKLKDNKILVTATVTSIDGKIVAKIIDNEWQTPKAGEYFDRNFDDNGFEIKDSYDIIVLQVSAKNDIITISGFFDIGDAKMVYGDNSHQLYHYNYGLQAYKSIGGSIKQIFKYPSEKYINQRL